MHFRPSHYGATDPAALLASLTGATSGKGPSGGSLNVDEILSVATVARELILPSDPVERKAVLQAKIANYEGMKRKFPIAALFYDNELRKMRAKLAATDRQIAKAFAGERSTQVFRYLGWTAGALVAGVLATMIYRNIATAKAK